MRRGIAPRPELAIGTVVRSRCAERLHPAHLFAEGREVESRSGRRIRTPGRARGRARVGGGTGTGSPPCDSAPGLQRARGSCSEPARAASGRPQARCRAPPRPPRRRARGCPRARTRRGDRRPASRASRSAPNLHLREHCGVLRSLRRVRVEPVGQIGAERLLGEYRQPVASDARVQAGVQRDPPRPGREPGAPVELGEARDHPEQRLLRRVLGVAGIEHHAARESKNGPGSASRSRQTAAASPASARSNTASSIRMRRMAVTPDSRSEQRLEDGQLTGDRGGAPREDLVGHAGRLNLGEDVLGCRSPRQHARRGRDFDAGRRGHDEIHDSARRIGANADGHLACARRDHPAIPVPPHRLCEPDGPPRQVSGVDQEPEHLRGVCIDRDSSSCPRASRSPLWTRVRGVGLGATGIRDRPRTKKTLRRRRGVSSAPAGEPAPVRLAADVGARQAAAARRPALGGGSHGPAARKATICITQFELPNCGAPAL